jgi:diguanylate cyclase (GGDEF)-like protein
MATTWSSHGPTTRAPAPAAADATAEGGDGRRAAYLRAVLLESSAPDGSDDEPALRPVRPGCDPLTGALTRDRLRWAVNRALAVREPAAVCVVDLDNFRFVNEVHGHTVGDRLLTAAAAAIAACLRPRDLLGRIGADEFALVLPATDAAGALAMAEHVLTAVRTGARVSAALEDVRITASIGVAAFEPACTLSATGVLAEADLAMIAAKTAGRDRLAVADLAAARTDDVRDSLRWSGRIREALESGGLTLQGQPIVPLAGPGPERIELLVRLRDADVRPAEFLATAERFGQIQAIDGWVVARALDLLARTREVVLHVNLAAASIGDGHLTAFIERAMRATAIDPARLVFEITESAAIIDVPAVRTAITRLRDVGCAVALDDFGAGFASFAHLKELPFDMLKIDGRFVRDLPTSPVDRLAVAAMATIARGLGMTTVAEYVGDDDTLSLLRELGVDHAQGYHVGAPRPVDDLLASTA